jgi:hypothetical protein
LFYCLFEIRFKWRERKKLRLRRSPSRKSRGERLRSRSRATLNRSSRKRRKFLRSIRDIDWKIGRNLSFKSGTSSEETRLLFPGKLISPSSEIGGSEISSLTHLSIISITPFSSPILSIGESLGST